MSKNNSGRTEIPILILSILAVVVAGALSMVTMSSKSDKNAVSGVSIPSQIVDEAAQAGVEAAKWHIQCHGRTTSGSIGPHFWINGATYSVQWDDMNLRDSTVIVRSVGDYAIGSNQNYQVNLESKIKIDFLPAHTNAIFTSYYSEKRGADSLSK